MSSDIDPDSAAYDELSELREFSDDAELFQALGKVFSKREQYDLALAAYEISLEFDPCDGWTHLYLGNWYYREEEYEAALVRFEYANQLMPDIAVSFWAMADVLEAQGQYPEAEEMHHKAMSVDPSDNQAKRQYLEYRRRRREA